MDQEAKDWANLGPHCGPEAFFATIAYGWVGIDLAEEPSTNVYTLWERDKDGNAVCHGSVPTEAELLQLKARIEGEQLGIFKPREPQ